MRNEMTVKSDECFMRQAIALAKEAASLGEIPVGAVIVKDGEILCGTYNLRETDKRATAHAEILAVEEACRLLGGWRLSGCTLYVTLEPCPMCTGALLNARIDRVVFGAKDAVAGCCGSLVNLCAYPFNHSFALTGGVCEEECRALLQEFFAKKRKKY